MSSVHTSDQSSLVMGGCAFGHSSSRQVFIASRSVDGSASATSDYRPAQLLLYQYKMTHLQMAYTARRSKTRSHICKPVSFLSQSLRPRSYMKQYHQNVHNVQQKQRIFPTCKLRLQNVRNYIANSAFRLNIFTEMTKKGKANQQPTWLLTCVVITSPSDCWSVGYTYYICRTC